MTALEADPGHSESESVYFPAYKSDIHTRDSSDFLRINGNNYDNTYALKKPSLTQEIVEWLWLLKLL